MASKALSKFEKTKLKGYRSTWRQLKWEERLFEVCYSKQVNYQHLCLEDSKTGKWVGKVYNEEKGEDFRYAFTGGYWHGKAEVMLNRC